MRPQHFVTLLVLLALAVSAAPAHAGGIVSVCDEAHLRAALAGGGPVTFSCSGTITLTAEIVIAADTTIDGRGQTVTLSGNHAHRVFTVNSGVTLNLTALTVTNGNTGGGSDGGGILNSGTVNVDHSTFAGNSAYQGGGIYNFGGTVTVSDSTFDGNGASDSGGSINNAGGVVTVSNSRFAGNSALYGGGGIRNASGTLNVSGSTFAGNAARYGGGIFNQDALTVDSSTFSGNGTLYSEGEGGGIFNRGTLTVSNSTFDGNTASGGGGIANWNVLAVSNSTFSGNNAGHGGSIANYTGGPRLVRLKNTIVADSRAGGNCFGGITDGGGNLSYPDTTCPGINSDPRLGPYGITAGRPGRWRSCRAARPSMRRMTPSAPRLRSTTSTSAASPAPRGRTATSARMKRH